MESSSKTARELFEDVQRKVRSKAIKTITLRGFPVMTDTTTTASS